MTDPELLKELSKRFPFKMEFLVDQHGRRGIQLKASGRCGADEYSFTSLHRDTEEECISDMLDWISTRCHHKYSPDRVCGGICMAASRPELELKLGLMQS